MARPSPAIARKAARLFLVVGVLNTIAPADCSGREPDQSNGWQDWASAFAAATVSQAASAMHAVKEGALSINATAVSSVAKEHVSGVASAAMNHTSHALGMVKARVETINVTGLQERAAGIAAQTREQTLYVWDSVYEKSSAAASVVAEHASRVDLSPLNEQLTQLQKQATVVASSAIEHGSDASIAAKDKAVNLAAVVAEHASTAWKAASTQATSINTTKLREQAAGVASSAGEQAGSWASVFAGHASTVAEQASIILEAAKNDSVAINFTSLRKKVAMFVSHPAEPTANILSPLKTRAAQVNFSYLASSGAEQIANIFDSASVKAASVNMTDLWEQTKVAASASVDHTANAMNTVKTMATSIDAAALHDQAASLASTAHNQTWNMFSSTKMIAEGLWQQARNFTFFMSDELDRADAKAALISETEYLQEATAFRSIGAAESTAASSDDIAHIQEGSSSSCFGIVNLSKSASMDRVGTKVVCANETDLFIEGEDPHNVLHGMKAALVAAMSSGHPSGSFGALTTPSRGESCEGIPLSYAVWLVLVSCCCTAVAASVSTKKWAHGASLQGPTAQTTVHTITLEVPERSFSKGDQPQQDCNEEAIAVDASPQNSQAVASVSSEQVLKQDEMLRDFVIPCATE
jgi:hypothetical protein